MLPLLILVPVLLAAYILLQRRRRRFALRYASLSLLKEAVGPGPGIRRHIPPALFLASMAVMIVALARPQAEVQVPSFDGTVVLAIDVSGSMTANDLNPNRMEAAKVAARDFINQQPNGVRVGVVAFSGFAAIVQSPTSDRRMTLSAINLLQPQRSTAIGEGLLASLRAIDPQLEIESPASRFDRQGNGRTAQGGAPAPAPTAAPQALLNPSNSGIVVLLSDGQNTSGIDPMEAAAQAKALGIKVFTVGIGTTEGTVLRLGGRGMRVRLDEDVLRQIADTTGGQYFNAQTDKDLQTIYHDLVRQFGVRNEQTELTAYATGLAALLALAGGILSMLWFSRLP
jgi:Ca-activated chloride channel family protein